jgi:hypothetical protein
VLARSLLAGVEVGGEVALPRKRRTPFILKGVDN